MVRHQYVCAQRKTVAFPIVLQSLKIAQPIFVIVKDLLALVDAHYDMIKRSGKFHPRFSRQGPKLLRSAHKVQPQASTSRRSSRGGSACNSPTSRVWREEITIGCLCRRSKQIARALGAEIEIKRSA